MKYCQMKPNNTNIAKFYGLTRQTIGTYRKSEILWQKITYEALKNYFIEQTDTTGYIRNILRQLRQLKGSEFKALYELIEFKFGVK